MVRGSSAIDFHRQCDRSEYPGSGVDGCVDFRAGHVYILSDAGPALAGAGFVEHLQRFRSVAAGVWLCLLARIHVSTVTSRNKTDRICTDSFPLNPPIPYSCASGASASRPDAADFLAPHGSHPRVYGWSARRRSPLVSQQSLCRRVVAKAPVHFEGRTDPDGLGDEHFHIAVLSISGFVLGVIAEDVLIAQFDSNPVSDARQIARDRRGESPTSGLRCNLG